MDRSGQDLGFLNRTVLFASTLFLTVWCHSEFVREFKTDLFVDGLLTAAKIRLIQVVTGSASTHDQVVLRRLVHVISLKVCFWDATEFADRTVLKFELV